MGFNFDEKEIIKVDQVDGQINLTCGDENKTLTEVTDPGHRGWKELANPEVPKLFSYNPTCYWFMGRLY